MFRLMFLKEPFEEANFIDKNAAALQRQSVKLIQFLEMWQRKDLKVRNPQPESSGSLVLLLLLMSLVLCCSMWRRLNISWMRTSKDCHCLGVCANCWLSIYPVIVHEL